MNVVKDVKDFLNLGRRFSSPAGATLEDLKAGEAEIAASVERKRERYVVVSSGFGELMAKALADGDIKRQAALRKELNDAHAEIQAEEAALLDQRRSIAERIEADRAAALAARWKRTRELCAKREKAAAELQRAVKVAAEAWLAMQAATSEIGGVLPAPRPWKVLNGWHFSAHVTFEAQLFAMSEGGIGDERAYPSTRYSSKAAYLAGEPDVVGVVERQHRQVLGGATSILLPEAA